jgi:hypothetical protein
MTATDDSQGLSFWAESFALEMTRRHPDLESVLLTDERKVAHDVEHLVTNGPRRGAAVQLCN